jgi:hypothetical protein
MKPQLTFCTNILPGQTWSEHADALALTIPQIQKHLGNRPLQFLGLRLSAAATEELLKPLVLAEFKSWLESQSLYVPMVNGFPFGTFHDEVVKDQVHQPDWTNQERITYTENIANVLTQLIPSGIDIGGISTSPLSYRPWQDEPMKNWEQLMLATRNIAKWVVFANHLNHTTSNLIRLEIEPEPDGLLDDLDSTIDFFKSYLWVYGKEILMSDLGASEEEALLLLKQHVCVCFDVCHFAVLHQPVVEALQKLDAEGISIGRIQLSSALVAKDLDGIEALKPFAEPIYLHQAAVLLKNGSVKRFLDLQPALDWCEQNEFQELRTHYHVPLFQEAFGNLHTTQQEVIDTLVYVKSNIPALLLEVETYTWSVLPTALQFPLAESIARELLWVQEVWE